MVYCRRMARHTYVLISTLTGKTYGYPYPRVFTSKASAQEFANRLNGWWAVAGETH